MPRVLVLDAQGQHALCFARSLDKRGVRVTAGGRSRYLPTMLSKHVDMKYVHPDPRFDPDRFIEHLVRFLDETDHFAVIPMTDRNHSLLSKHKERIESTGTKVGVENWARFVTANDKKYQAELVAGLPVPMPRTVAPSSMESVAEIAPELPYPAVIKPRRTSMWDSEGTYHNLRISERNYVESPSALVETYRSLCLQNECLRRCPPIIQEWVPGQTIATGTLADDGTIISYFQEKRLRTYPVTGGIGALRQGICEPEMLAYAAEITKALEWTGPAYVEFMKTPEDDCYLIEVNGRLWGSVSLAVNSGVDIPWIHYCQLHGLKADQMPTYRTDFKQRRLFHADAKWLVSNLSKGDVSALGPFIRAFFDAREEFLRPEDPLPSIGAILRAGRLAIRASKGR